MMSWYGWDHMNGWVWVAMTLSTVLVLALLVLGGVLLLRAGRQPSERTYAAPPRSPEQLLAERYTRGEIDEEEYRRRLATLSDTGAPTR